MEEAAQRAGDGAHDESSLSDRVTDDVSAQMQKQSARAADSAQHAADAARQAAESLRGQEAWMAGLVEQGADRLAGFAQTLREKDLRSLLADMEDFARRQPMLFTGAAMVLGFALTRAAGMTAKSTAGTAARMPEGAGHGL